MPRAWAAAGAGMAAARAGMAAAGAGMAAAGEGMAAAASGVARCRAHLCASLEIVVGASVVLDEQEADRLPSRQPPRIRSDADDHARILCLGAPPPQVKLKRLSGLAGEWVVSGHREGGLHGVGDRLLVHLGHKVLDEVALQHTVSTEPRQLDRRRVPPGDVSVRVDGADKRCDARRTRTMRSASDAAGRVGVARLYWLYGRRGWLAAAAGLAGSGTAGLAGGGAAAVRAAHRAWLRE